MIPWVTTVVSELGMTLHPAATCNVRAASVLGPCWLSAARTLHHVRATTTNGRVCSRLRSEKVGFLWMLPWYNGHSDTFSMPPPFHTGQKKNNQKKKKEKSSPWLHGENGNSDAFLYKCFQWWIVLSSIDDFNQHRLFRSSGGTFNTDQILQIAKDSL